MKLLSTTCLLRKNCQSNKDAKWKQMFFYRKGSEEWLQIVMFVFWVTGPTDFLVRHDSPRPVSWAPAGARAQTESSHGSWGSQQALKTEDGLGLSVSAQLRATTPAWPPPPPSQNRPESHSQEGKRGQGHFILWLSSFFLSGEGQATWTPLRWEESWEHELPPFQFMTPFPKALLLGTFVAKGI